MKPILSILICFLTVAVQAQSFEEFISNGDKFYDEQDDVKNGKLSGQ